MLLPLFIHDGVTCVDFTVASLLLVAQYTRLLLANEVTTEVPVPPQTLSPCHQTWVRLSCKHFRINHCNSCSVSQIL